MIKDWMYETGRVLEPGKYCGFSQVIDRQGDVCEILTDFGNIIKVTARELIDGGHKPLGLINDWSDPENPTWICYPTGSIVERFNEQRELLKSAAKRLKELGYDVENTIGL